MEYQPVKPPFTQNIGDMREDELKRYFAWFLEVMPERLQQLARAVTGTIGFEDWLPDYTAASLEPLSRWLAAQAETRKRTPEEVRRLTGSSSIDVGDEELTERT